MGWSYISIPKLQWWSLWSLGMDKWFHPTHFWECDYLSMLGLKLIHVRKKGPPGSDTKPWWRFFSNLSRQLHKIGLYNYMLLSSIRQFPSWVVPTEVVIVFASIQVAYICALIDWTVWTIILFVIALQGWYYLKQTAIRPGWSRIGLVVSIINVAIVDPTGGLTVISGHYNKCHSLQHKHIYNHHCAKWSMGVIKSFSIQNVIMVVLRHCMLVVSW